MESSTVSGIGTRSLVAGSGGRLQCGAREWLSDDTQDGTVRIPVGRQRAALDVYDRGEWPVRDWSIAVTMRRSGYGDEDIRKVLG